MIADGVGDFRVDALIKRIVAAHEALQFGEFADHAGDQIGLGEARRAFGLLDIGANGLGDLTGQRPDALDAFALAAKLGVEGDGVEFFRPFFEADLAVLIPEEFRIGQSGGDNLVVAGDDGLAAILGHEVRHHEIVIGQSPQALALRGSLRSHLRVRVYASSLMLRCRRGRPRSIGHPERETFLVVLDRRGDDFRRQAQITFIESAHQHHGPFDEAGGFLQQAFVLDQFETLRKGQIASFGANGFDPRVGVNYDLVVMQLLDIILEAADLD